MANDLSKELLFIKRWESMASVRLEVGILDGDAQKTKEVRVGETTTTATLGDVAHWNHFGTTEIPARPFLTIAQKRNADKLVDLQARAVKAVTERGAAPEKAAALIGQAFVGMVQQAIADGIPPANAPETIARKGSSKPLIDTGQMRSSITYAIRVVK